MTRQQITAALQNVQIRLVVSSKQHEGTKGLYDAACYANDGVLAGEMRQRLHDLLDAQLDLVQEAITLGRQLMQCSD